MLALPVLMVGPLTIARTSTDIFPHIDIPVVTASGIRAACRRITSARNAALVNERRAAGIQTRRINPNVLLLRG